MRRLLLENIRTIKYCGKSFLQQEVSFKLLTAALGYPFLLLLLNLSLKVANVPYLTNELILKYLKHPFSIMSIVIMLLILSVYTLFEICMISVYYDYNITKTNGSQYSVLKIICRRFVGILKRKNVLMILFGIFTLPMLSVTNLSLWAFIKPIPSSVVKINMTAKVIIAILLVILFVLAALSVFMANIVIDQDCTAAMALKKSIKLVKKNVLKTVFYIVLLNLITALAVLLVYALYSVIVIAGVKLFGKNDIGVAVYLTALRGLSSIITIIIFVLYIPLTYMMILSMYKVYTNADYTNEPVIKVPDVKPKYEKTYRFVSIVLVIATIIVNACYVRNAMVGNPFKNVGVAKIPKITAHRGSAIRTPENTLAAFQGAIDDMADYAELDVKQTKDNVIIVLHDPNLKRTTGVKKDIWTVNYDFVKTLDAGSWFSDEYAGEQVPTLEEVLIMCKGKIKLNIEIKPTGHDNNLERAVVELIEKYDFENECVVTSMKYDVLKQVKKCNPKIKTGYIMKAAYGKYYNMECADFFSVNYSFVTKKNVDLIHNNGKSIHVWTVNGESQMREMVKMGVDNIITDNPVMCREVAYSENYNDKMLDILKYVFE